MMDGPPQISVFVSSLLALDRTIIRPSYCTEYWLNVYMVQYLTFCHVLELELARVSGQ